MISKKPSAPFIADLKPSQKIQRLVILIHLLALGAGFANALPFGLKLLIALFIAFHFKLTFSVFKTECRKLIYTEKQSWQLSENGAFSSIEISKSTVITPFFIFLHLQNKPAVLIANDSLDEDIYRELIVKLKITASDSI